MGANFQSDSEIRSQRLSKPRTSTSSSNLLNLTQQKNDSSSPLTPTDTYGFGENATVVTSPTGDVRSRRDARSKLREYLYGPNNQAQTPSSEDEDDGPKRFSKVAGLKKRLSRSGSSFAQLPSAKSSSLYLTNPSGSRLLLSELSTVDLEETERIAQDIKEKAFADSIAAQNHVSSPVDEDKHPDSVMAPIRRRSLFTPGIATRDPNDILRKPPPPNRSQSQVDLAAYYYNPLLPEISPLSQLAALNITRDGRSTPSDLDYSHLGGLKLGTLRVTNGGAASPAPDARTRGRAVSDVTQKDDRYTASAVDRDNRAVPRGHEAGHMTSQVPAGSNDSHVAVNQNGTHMTPEGCVETPRNDVQSNGILVRSHRSEDLADTEDKTIGRSCLKFLSSNGSLASTRYSPTSPGRASVIAQDYMSELPGSPFSKPEDQSGGILEPEFKPTSDAFRDVTIGENGANVLKSHNHSAKMWKLFINDAEVRHANSGTREDAFRTLTANAASVSEAASRSVSTSPNARNRGSVGTLGGSVDGKSSVVVDSGYHSNESLKTLGSADGSSNLEEPSSRLTLGSSHRLSRSLSGPREMPQPAPGREKLEIPEQPDRPAPIRPSAMLTSKSTSAVPTASQTSRTTTTTTVTVSYLSNPVPSERPATQDGPNPNQISVQQSRPVEPTPAKAHKLRKPRPLSQPLPVDLITLQRNLSLTQADIPPIPSNVSMKHADRLREFPLLEHTFPSSQHTYLSDTMSIEEPVYVPIRFPSPANALEEESPSKDISITTRLSQHSTREPNASPLKGDKESVALEEEEFSISDIVRSPSWSDFGRRGREKRRQEKERKAEKEAASKITIGGQDALELDEEGLPVSDICRSPSWSTFKGKKKQTKKLEPKKRKSTKSPKKEEVKKRNLLTRSRSSTITKEEPRSNHPIVEATIADFGTVTESLGGSPYDIARAAMTGTTPRTESMDISYPHQMSTARPRSKSTIGMNEEHAVEFARLRSRGRSQSSFGSEVPTRRSFDDRTARPAQMVRPHSMYGDIPPVPALPRYLESDEPSNSYYQSQVHNPPQGCFSANPKVPDVLFLEEREQREMIDTQDTSSRTRSRPQSMIIDVQPTPAFAAVDLPRHQQILSSRGEAPVSITRPRSMIIEEPPRLAPVPPKTRERRDMFNDRLGAPGRNIRPRSMFLDIPPVPALPSSEQVEQREAEISRSGSESSMTLVGPRKVVRIAESPKKDIWESAALAEENAMAPRSHDVWEAQRQAWANRRKSAGDALLQQNRSAESFFSPTQLESTYTHAGAPTYLSPNTALTSRSRTPSPPKPLPRSFHKPLDSIQPTETAPISSKPSPHSSSTNLFASIPTPPLIATPSITHTHLAGRYDGGLAYGYEPGIGVGGSAGTRSAKTGASRKSIGFSQGYGVDLSDVPIFVVRNGRE